MNEQIDKTMRIWYVVNNNNNNNNTPPPTEDSNPTNCTIQIGILNNYDFYSSGDVN